MEVPLCEMQTSMRRLRRDVSPDPQALRPLMFCSCHLDRTGFTVFQGLERLHVPDNISRHPDSSPDPLCAVPFGF
jgi:hypothetical protein